VHTVVVLYLDGTRTAIISQDGEFTPATPLSGFSTIYPGYNMASFGTFAGTATNASQLGGVVANHYLRTDIDNTSTGNLRIINDSGITLGAGLDLTLSVTGINASITNNTTNGDISLVTNDTQYLHINAASDTIEVAVDPTTSAGIATKGYVDSSFVDSVLTGVPTAPTASAGTVSTQLATTEFVVNNSGFLKNKIYQSNSYLEVTDSGVGSASLVLDNVAVMQSTSSGINLLHTPTAPTQSQTYTSVGNTAIATTSYVHTAGQWWDGSAKFVSADAPNPGVNDIGSNDGDIWFQYTT
jgi:hypothetical protein